MAQTHNNPDLWGPEPVDQFVPERFLPERKTNGHSMAYLPPSATKQSSSITTMVLTVLQKGVFVDLARESKRLLQLN